MYARLDVCGRLVEGGPRQIQDLVNLEYGEEAWLRPCKLTDSKLPRKATKNVSQVSVPETDTGRSGENPKAHV